MSYLLNLAILDIFAVWNLKAQNRAHRRGRMPNTESPFPSSSHYTSVAKSFVGSMKNEPHLFPGAKKKKLVTKLSSS